MLIDCGSNVFLGDHRECWPWGDTTRFDKTIHVWRQSDRDRKVACGCVDSARWVAEASVNVFPAKNLFTHWREGEKLDQLSVPVDEIMRFAANPSDRLLIHCAAGHCRSAHLAVLAGVARGLDPLATVDRVNRGEFTQAGKLPGWYWETLTTIAKLAVPPR